MGRKANPKPEDQVNSQETPKEGNDNITDSTLQTTSYTEETADNTTETPSTEENTEITFDVNKKYEIVCSERAGRNFYGCTGELIQFDEKGIAVVCEAEAKHYSKLDNCKIREHKE